MPTLAERLSQMLLGGMRGWELGARLNLMDEGQEDRREQREADRMLRSAALADRGIYKGETPTETHDIEVPVPGLPVPLRLRLSDRDRYRDIGGGYYQDFAQSATGRAIQAQQGREDLARQNRFFEVWKDQTKKAETIGEQNRVREAVRASGLFTDAEESLVDAIPGIGDNVAQSAINARTRRRYDGPTGRTGDDPAERAIKHEDDRRKAVIAGNEAKMRRLGSGKDPITGELLPENQAEIDELEAVTDSIRSRVGSAPDLKPAATGRDTRTIPTADVERDLTTQAQDAIRRGADPEKVNARLQQLIRQARGAQ